MSRSGLSLHRPFFYFESFIIKIPRELHLIKVCQFYEEPERDGFLYPDW